MEKADKRKYAEDKPLVCENCYFLEQTKKWLHQKTVLLIFSQNSQRKIRKKQDNVWVALMENILLVLDTVCRKFYRT